MLRLYDFWESGNCYKVRLVLAQLGIDTEAEPSARDVAALIQNLNTNGAGALFVENITIPDLVEQISKKDSDFSLTPRLRCDRCEATQPRSVQQQEYRAAGPLPTGRGGASASGRP